MHWSAALAAATSERAVATAAVQEQAPLAWSYNIRASCGGWESPIRQGANYWGDVTEGGGTPVECQNSAITDCGFLAEPVEMLDVDGQLIVVGCNYGMGQLIKLYPGAVNDAALLAAHESAHPTGMSSVPARMSYVPARMCSVPARMFAVWAHAFTEPARRFAHWHAWAPHTDMRSGEPKFQRGGAYPRPNMPVGPGMSPCGSRICARTQDLVFRNWGLACWNRDLVCENHQLAPGSPKPGAGSADMRSGTGDMRAGTEHIRAGT